VDLIQAIERKIKKFHTSGPLAGTTLNSAADVANPLFSDMKKSDSGLLWVPTREDQYEALMSTMFNVPFRSMLQSYSWGADIAAEPTPPPVEPEFEVNMVEALEGWRAWEINERGDRFTLESINAAQVYWHPGEVMVAVCRNNGWHLAASPIKHCTCGIYAGDDFAEVRQYAEPDDRSDTVVFGRVSGWGRYVRGGAGWRAQFAYPKSFHVPQTITPDELNFLREFRVPIFMDQPILMYNPQEDGYEYGDDQADRNFRASGTSSAQEADDGDDD
jgi:hypothetical protein